MDLLRGFRPGRRGQVRVLAELMTLTLAALSSFALDREARQMTRGIDSVERFSQPATTCRLMQIALTGKSSQLPVSFRSASLLQQISARVQNERHS